LGEEGVTLHSLIAKAYPVPEWVVFYEVANAPGFSAHRYADAVALGIWPSRGHTVVGFEVKDDRRDWLRELKNPAKADVMVSHCDQWWIVARPNVVKLEELPEPWGLYTTNEDATKLKVVKPAPPLPDRNPLILTRTFAAAMLRRVSETTIPKADVERLVQERVAKFLATNPAQQSLERLQKNHTKLLEDLETFKRITGVDLQGWRGTASIAKSVDTVLHLQDRQQGWARTVTLLKQASQQLLQAADEVQACVTQFDAGGQDV
jgi:hypothetical protein